MAPLPWRVITRWITEDGSEFVHVIAFSNAGAARAEAQRLTALIGTLIQGKTIKNVRVEVLPDPPPRADDAYP